MPKSARKRSRGKAQRMDLMSGKPSKEQVQEKSEEFKRESRGDLEKRHHFEIKQWRLEEKELRRQRNKIKGNNPEATKEKKRILLLIKEKDTQLKARHLQEKEACLAENKSSSQANTAPTLNQEGNDDSQERGEEKEEAMQM